MSGASFWNDRGHPNAAATHHRAALCLHRGQRGGDLSTPGSGRRLRLCSANAGALRLCEARQAGQGGGVEVSVGRDRPFAPADGASGPAVARDGGDPGSAWRQPRPAVCAQVQRRGHPSVGGGRRGVRADVGLGDARDPAAPVRGVWRSALRAAGDDFQRAHLQSARLLDLSRQAHGMDQDAGGDGEHRSAPGPATRWATGSCPCRQPFTKAIGTAKRACI